MTDYNHLVFRLRMVFGEGIGDEVAREIEKLRAELVEWFAAKQAKAQASRQQWKVGDAPRTLADLAESIRAADTLTADHAAKIWAGMGELAKALRKAGHPKPKRERTAPAALAGQADLLAEAAEPAPAVLPPASTGV